MTAIYQPVSLRDLRAYCIERTVSKPDDVSDRDWELFRDVVLKLNTLRAAGARHNLSHERSRVIIQTIAKNMGILEDIRRNGIALKDEA